MFPFSFPVHFLPLFLLLASSFPFLSTHPNHELGGESESTSSTPTQFSLPSNTLVLHSVYVCALKCVCMSKGGKVSMAQLELQSSRDLLPVVVMATGDWQGCWLLEECECVCICASLCEWEQRPSSSSQAASDALKCAAALLLAYVTFLL